MLRQSQTKESSHESELEEQLAAVQLSLDSLQQKFDATCMQNKHLVGNIEEITQDKERTEKRCKDLSQMLDALRQTVEKLEAENRTQSLNHQEALKQQRLQNETLNECYKKQFFELDQKHSAKLEELKRATSQLSKNSNDNRTIQGHEQPKVSVFKNTTSDEQKIDWLLMERQEGEVCETKAHFFWGRLIFCFVCRDLKVLVPVICKERVQEDGGN